MKSNERKILKIIIISSIFFSMLVLLAYISNLIYNNIQIKDMLFVEGILLTLLSISSLFSTNINDAFTREY